MCLMSWASEAPGFYHVCFPFGAAIIYPHNKAAREAQFPQVPQGCGSKVSMPLSLVALGFYPNSAACSDRKE